MFEFKITFPNKEDEIICYRVRGYRENNPKWVVLYDNTGKTGVSDNDLVELITQLLQDTLKNNKLPF